MATTAPFVPSISDPTPFGESERVIYESNPLEFVICQVRFPAILKISAEPPADFQEPLRSTFPLFKEVPPLDIGSGAPLELSKFVGGLLPISLSRGYELSSPDNYWQVTLTQESLALTCKKYRRWEQFRERLLGCLDVLDRVYAPIFFTRIGLRYRDLIVRRPLHLDEASWGELLSPNLASGFQSPIADWIEDCGHQLVFRLQGETKVTLNHGLGKKGEEGCYIIDSDFYTMQTTGANDAGRILDYFNRQAGRLFHWCITEELHQAMGPGQVP